MSAITVTREGTRFIARFAFDYATKDLVKHAGFRFDPDRKIWWTDRPEIAAKVAGDNAEILARINADLAEKHSKDLLAIEASRATDAEIDVPAPAGLAYLPYQRGGIAYAASHPDVLIADEMGLGKTIQACGIINSDGSLSRVLVIAPASLKLNWQRELQKWLTRPLRVAIANGTFPAADIVITNYEQVNKHREMIDAFAPDLLVCDESHYLKNGKAQRTAAVFGKWDAETKLWKPAPIKAKRRVFLTGTPVLNRPKELWTLLHALDPKGLGKNWKDFHVRYCAGHKTSYGWDIDGSSHLDELQAKLRAACMVRRLKSEVLTELPPKRRQIIALIPSPAAKAIVAREQAAFKAREERLEWLLAAVEVAKASDDPEAYKAALERLHAGAQEAFEDIARVRHEVAVAKVPQVVEHLTDCLENGKVVVFAHHHDVIDGLHKAFPTAAVLTGETPVAKRQAEVDRFQRDPDCTLFIGSIGAAGVGITLTASSHVVFAELDWTPGRISQAEDRCHRIGQRDNVTAQHVVLDGSLDMRMAEILVEKQAVIERALDRGEQLPEAQAFLPPVAPAASRSLTQTRVAEEAAKIPPEVISAVHGALRALAGLCDGAINLDDKGFNKIDSRIGKSLAASASLSPKQAVLGRSIVRKYHRQLPADLMAVIKGEAA